MGTFDPRGIFLLPTEPEEKCREWIISQYGKYAEEDYIVFRLTTQKDEATDEKLGVAKCRCTACGESFDEPACVKADGTRGFYDRLIRPTYSGETGDCPNCGKHIRAAHVSSIPSDGKICNNVWFAEFRKIKSGRWTYPALILWRVATELTKIGMKEIKIMPWDAYIFDGKKTHFFAKWYKYYTAVKITDCWEYKSKCFDDVGSLSKKQIFKPGKRFFDGTCLENAKINEFIRDSEENRCCILAYIRTYMAHPKVENLVTYGAAKDINRWIIDQSTSYYYKSRFTILSSGINWREKKPLRMLGLTKEEFNYCHRNGSSLQDIEIVRLAREAGFRIHLEDVGRLEIGKTDAIRILKRGIDICKAKRYTEKQNDTHKSRYIGLNYYCDYLDMADEFGIDQKFPRDLVEAHDECVRLRNMKNAEKKIEAQKGKTKSFEKSSKHLSIYEYHADGLFIRAAVSPEELIREGASLGHCVGGTSYIDSHIAGRHYIFFVRKEAEPDKSYYTLDFDEKKMEVIQNRGKANCARTPEVEAFEKEWLEFVKKIRIQKAG